ncbi:MAG TPA: hypothetical protein VKQ36_14325, partial [Ktedonobacterales bacterium]|nr:hypothetical protein [Ktedonobacterales bacterium]
MGNLESNPDIRDDPRKQTLWLDVTADTRADPTRSQLIEQRIAQAAALLRAGGLVAFPTETVYG